MARLRLEMANVSAILFSSGATLVVAGALLPSWPGQDRPVLLAAAGIAYVTAVVLAERIVENLLANAAKHNPAGTALWVRIRAVDGGALLAVEDAGPGVPHDLKRSVFEPFQQGPRSTDAASPGTGIGLALVARFAELHGGRAWVDDREDGGSRFNVFLPDDPPDSALLRLG
ncbi:MAG: ATP-binding protein [Actinobacteria bacterium]|nr:ATP-binding protein [Actinomycetota bacterium]